MEQHGVLGGGWGAVGVNFRILFSGTTLASVEGGWRGIVRHSNTRVAFETPPSLPRSFFIVLLSLVVTSGRKELPLRLDTLLKATGSGYRLPVKGLDEVEAPAITPRWG